MPSARGLSRFVPKRRSSEQWRGRPLALMLLVALPATLLGGCIPAANAGSLAPTLSMASVRGGDVAMQDGIPVPSFGFQGRPRLDLGGPWRVERKVFDADVSLTPRDRSLPQIVSEANGRERAEFDDHSWKSVQVPGALNPPPDRFETGAWYRRAFAMPLSWDGRTLTLKFGAVNYIADVWLNGRWLGYHEGGSTPFAFDATAAARPGVTNVLVVRVDNPPWGTRNDIVPWGLADWWNFGGIVRPVWIEASDPLHVVRADVVPHLDGADVSIVVHNAGKLPANAVLTVDVLPGSVTSYNLLDPDPRALLGLTRIPADYGNPDHDPRPPYAPVPLAHQVLDAERLRPNDIVRVDTSFLISEPASWTPLQPSLYVLRVTASVGGAVVDQLHEAFGLRQVTVDRTRGAVLLNGQPVFLPGVAAHDQVLERSAAKGPHAHLPAPAEVRAQLARARQVGARLLRPGHAPANPVLLDLADRLGFAVWEEIPLYHYTPQTFSVAMARGIPQQMLREMALRDINHPSVLFHGLANESTGEEERTAALTELRDVDRGIDGTRLTGQAAYGYAPADPTSDPLDVAGFTFYYGVFYGTNAAVDTEAALATAQRAFPRKPIMILEFGTWADGTGRPAQQRRLLQQTAGVLLAQRASLGGGHVSGIVWWTLEDYATLRPGLEVEHFGLFSAGGRARPAAGAARELFAPLLLGIESGPVSRAAAGQRALPAESTQSGLRLLGYAAFGVGMALAALAVAFLLLATHGGRGHQAWRRAEGDPSIRSRAEGDPSIRSGP